MSTIWMKLLSCILLPFLSDNGHTFCNTKSIAIILLPNIKYLRHIGNEEVFLNCIGPHWRRQLRETGTRVRVRWRHCKALSTLATTGIVGKTRFFMKIFRTASPAIVIECQRSFCFLPVTSQIVINTVKFLQVFLATDNSLCQLFRCSAVNQSNDILCEWI